MQRDSVEYLEFTLNDRDGKDLSADVVQVSLAPYGSSPTTWLPCTHVTGPTWRTTTAVTWSTANYPLSSYRVYAKVSDSPETPLTELGTLRIH